jgi:spore coat polysaccharide biosynthesis protein SpsF (cytidylyltransferase family)
VTTLAIVQARMSSTRLPGKVLADVEGEPMLALQLRRLERSRAIDRIVVATSDDPSDDPIAAAAVELSVKVHRGPLHDVLARFAGAAAGHDGPVLRLTADCPFIDPAVVDDLVALFTADPVAAYGSNVDERTYPDGLDVEIFTPEALTEAARRATDPVDREHVTTLIRRERDRFPAVSLVRTSEPLGHLRWTVDDQADLEFVRNVVRRLGDRRHAATLEEILAAIRRPPSLGEAGLRG